METHKEAKTERAEKLNTAEQILREEYGVESKKLEESIVCTIDFGPGMGSTASVLVPITSQEYPLVRIAKNDTCVDAGEVREYLDAQLHDAEIHEQLYYILPIEGRQLMYVRVGTVEYALDEMAEASSVQVKVNFGIFLRPQGNGKPLKKTRSNEVVKMVAARRFGFAHIKSNPHLRGVLDHQ